MSGLSFTITLGAAAMPEDLVRAVRDITVETASDMAASFSVRFGMRPTATGDWSALDPDPFLPLTPLSIRLSLDGGLPEAVINGYVTAEEASWREGGRSALEVRGTDVTGLMNLEEKVKPWPNVSDSVIAGQIFGSYGLTPRVETTMPRLVEPEGTTMQRGTDIRFLRRLARRNGFDCYVLPDPLTGVDVGHFGPPSLSGRASVVLSVAMASASNVRELQARYDMTRPTGATATGLDDVSKATQPAAAPAAIAVPMGLQPALVRLLAGGRAVSVLPSDTGGVTTAELQPFVQAVADRSSMAVTIEGVAGADVGILRPGQLVALRGAGLQFNGLYLLTRVRLQVGEGRFEQRFTAIRNALTGTGAEAVVL